MAVLGFDDDRPQSVLKPMRLRGFGRVKFDVTVGPILTEQCTFRLIRVLKLNAASSDGGEQRGDPRTSLHPAIQTVRF